MTAALNGPCAVNPRTGELLAPDDLTQRIIVAARLLEEDAEKLIGLQVELSRVTARYQDTYERARSASTGGAADVRELDGRMACRAVTMPDDPLNIAERKQLLEGEVRSKKDHQHNLRAILSAYQTAARSIGVVYQAVR